jgi:GTPase
VAVIEREMNKRIETPQLNQVLTRAIAAYPPPFEHGRRFKLFYAFQKPAEPRTIVLFVNDTQCLTPHYERFLIDKIRAAWGFTGCRVMLKLRQRERREFVRGSGKVVRKPTKYGPRK